jgi:hypothetical protein
MALIKSKEERQHEKELKSRDMKFKDYPYLVAAKPREKYVFHSDYFDIDGSVATIMSFHHLDGASDGYPAFWGLTRISSLSVSGSSAGCRRAG